MNWQRYTQTLKEDPKLRKPVYFSLMEGVRNGGEIKEELFGKLVDRLPDQTSDAA
jgi:hypothetical protein